ncbi:MAG: ABC transporter permease [Lentisphaerae bacterium]|nr:ABC transporter permease [Lentisphaerota bacterium]
MKPGLWEYLVKRILLAAVTLVLILLTSYVLLRVAPGDPVKSSMIGSGGAGATGLSSDKPELTENEVMKKKLNFDKPILTGFVLWMKDVCRGDFGTSVSFDKGRPVTDLILERLPVTLRLNICAILLVYLLAIPIGLFSGVFPEGKFDKVTTVVLFFLFSMPVLWVALSLQALVCKGGAFPIFPVKGLEPATTYGLSTWRIVWETLLHYILPVLCMSYAGFAGLSRFTRSAMIDTLRQEYIRTARAKGVSEFDIVFSHAFRNILVIMVTLLAGLLPGLISGSLLIEYIFAIPGMGDLSMRALSSRDIPLIMALFSFSGFLTLLGFLISDILYVFVDPRISFRSRI